MQRRAISDSLLRTIELVDVGADYVLGIWRDPDGEEQLHEYRVGPAG